MNPPQCVHCSKKANPAIWEMRKGLRYDYCSEGCRAASTSMRSKNGKDKSRDQRFANPHE